MLQGVFKVGGKVYLYIRTILPAGATSYRVYGSVFEKDLDQNIRKGMLRVANEALMITRIGVKRSATR